MGKKYASLVESIKAEIIGENGALYPCELADKIFGDATRYKEITGALRYGNDCGVFVENGKDGGWTLSKTEWIEYENKSLFAR